MRIYRYLFFIVYSRWFRKDRDTSLATFSALLELSIYLGMTVAGVVFNSALWFGTAMPEEKTSKLELLIGVVPLMIFFYLINFFLLAHRGRREEILYEFKDVPKKELRLLRLYVALYAFISLMLLAGLPWLYYQIY
ncbi:hypothetical protein [Marinilabilia salmonicolor]|jgi:hypothetical protein|uniref:Uncharacterized protein n=1 Tax=Marinilabilia salmonicolor TaxID=989 RepID=A0A2T0XMM3_9BACT|nr:hypothetical protein [Marinilabilia salmonicolor]PRZ00181.1 hypothetical protein BY457_1065 [Marinilabilia salmonicolor]RCW30246.1 hypothetical protein DFO77_12372 [Marinilabilia salmonicolor]